MLCVKPDDFFFFFPSFFFFLGFVTRWATASWPLFFFQLVALNWGQPRGYRGKRGINRQGMPGACRQNWKLHVCLVGIGLPLHPLAGLLSRASIASTAEGCVDVATDSAYMCMAT